MEETDITSCISLVFGILVVVGSFFNPAILPLNDVAKLALGEAARHELVSDEVDVLVLVHEHVVDTKVGVTEVVEGSQGNLHVVILNLLNRLEVELLWRLSVDADGALHKEGAWLLGSIIGDFLVDRLHGLDTKDVAADLVAELDLASLQSEERGVAAFQRWGLELNRYLAGFASDNLLLESDNLGRHVVPRCLEQLGARGPGSLSVVAHLPGLGEAITAWNLVFVRDAFLDEACGITHALGWLLGDRGKEIIKFILLVLSAMRHLVLGRNESLAVVRADKPSGRVGRLTDLEEWVLSVHTVLLAGLAEVGV